MQHFYTKCCIFIVPEMCKNIRCSAFYARKNDVTDETAVKKYLIRQKTNSPLPLLYTSQAPLPELSESFPRLPPPGE